MSSICTYPPRFKLTEVNFCFLRGPVIRWGLMVVKHKISSVACYCKAEWQSKGFQVIGHKTEYEQDISGHTCSTCMVFPL